MGMLMIRHKVKDYDQWRPMFDKHSLMQQAAGLSNPRVFRSADDKSEIVVVFDTKDTKRAKENDGESGGHGRPDDLFSRIGLADAPRNTRALTSPHINLESSRLRG